MNTSGGIGNFIHYVEGFKNIDGKIIGEDGDIFHNELAPNDRQAWVNHLVEQHLKHESLDVPPPNFKIIMKDIVKEIARREIMKIFGNGK